MICEIIIDSRDNSMNSDITKAKIRDIVAINVASVLIVFSGADEMKWYVKLINLSSAKYRIPKCKAFWKNKKS